MKFQATKKITGGKLVRVKIESTDAGTQNHISGINISGDFFLHPEDALDHVQQKLAGLSTSSSPQIFEQEIERALAEKKAAFIGASAKDLAEIIHEALQSEPV